MNNKRINEIRKEMFFDSEEYVLIEMDGWCKGELHLVSDELACTFKINRNNTRYYIEEIASWVIAKYPILKMLDMLDEMNWNRVHAKDECVEGLYMGIHQLSENRYVFNRDMGSDSFEVMEDLELKEKLFGLTYEIKAMFNGVETTLTVRAKDMDYDFSMLTLEDYETDEDGFIEDDIVGDYLCELYDKGFNICLVSPEYKYMF